MDHMDNRRLGAEGSAVVSNLWHSQGPLALTMRIAHSLNRIVIATESVARLILLCGLLLALYYAADRKPPFAVLSVEPATAAPGEVITIRAAVRRDLERNCGADIWRYIYDADNVRFDLGGVTASPEMIRSMDMRTPGVLLFSVRVPEQAAIGPATHKTVLNYECNPAHVWWPIQVTADIPFTVRELNVE